MRGGCRRPDFLGGDPRANILKRGTVAGGEIDSVMASAACPAGRYQLPVGGFAVEGIRSRKMASQAVGHRTLRECDVGEIAARARAVDI